MSRFFVRVIAVLLLLSFILSGLALAQGEPSTLFFPLVFRAQITSPSNSLVSVAFGGIQVSEDSWSPSISADGRFVAFESTAGDLVSGDTNGYWDVFVHDR